VPVLTRWLGLDLGPQQLSVLQVSLRGVTVFLVALVMLRMSDRRFLARLSAFDAILGFILAAMLSRAVNGSSAFLPTLGGGFVLVGLHRLLATLAYRSHAFGVWLKGEAQVLAQDGRLNEARMRAAKISEHDLLEEARLHGPVDKIRRIRTATLERNGEVSVVPTEASQSESVGQHG
jgi:uncharacterized membrane protein YcaP (DUF421 family)